MPPPPFRIRFTIYKPNGHPSDLQLLKISKLDDLHPGDLPIDENIPKSKNFTSLSFFVVDQHFRQVQEAFPLFNLPINFQKWLRLRTIAENFHSVCVL